MADTNRQEQRIARLDTTLETDRLALSRFEGSEGLSELFEFTVEALSRKNDITVDDILGELSTITFYSAGKPQRYFNGHVANVEFVGGRNDNFVYRMVLRPWLWMLSLATDCCIFHDKTAPEIIKEVFDRHGFAKHDFRLTKSYPKLEYTVQYRESDLDFVRRLMEENGIAFFFVHSAQEHTLVLSDATTCYETMPGGSRPYVSVVGSEHQHHLKGEHFSSMVPQRRMTSGAVMFKDYDFKKPSANMDVNKSDAANYANSGLEVYDYPGRYVETSPGGELASTLLTSMRAADGRYRVVGDCVTAAPGMLFTLRDHYDGKLNREYLLLKCFHSYTGPNYRSSSLANGEANYDGSYEMMASDKPFAPPHLTRRPQVQGPQTAIVVNENDDSTEIDVDKWGRILVHFPWDRRSDKSMRCRLAQAWSGKNWGGMYIPRVGMEVIVEFLEGNPDMPMVTGTVYNNNNMPPYGLPEKKFLAGFKSQSTPKDGGGGGGERGYNEYVFDDTQDEELIRQHGQLDYDSKIERDERFEAGRDRFVKIGRHLTTEIGKLEKRTVGESRDTYVKDKDNLKVDNELKITVANKIEIICGNSSITMTPDTIKITSLNIVVEANDYTQKSVEAKHHAAANMDIKGGLVKINS